MGKYGNCVKSAIQFGIKKRQDYLNRMETVYGPYLCVVMVTNSDYIQQYDHRECSHVKDDNVLYSKHKPAITILISWSLLGFYDFV